MAWQWLYQQTHRLPRLSTRMVRTAFSCLTGLIVLGTGLLGQNVGANSPAAPTSSAESPYVWLGFFQEYSRLLIDANTKGKGNPHLLPHEQDKAGLRFGLSTTVNAKVIPVANAWGQRYAPLAGEQRANREAIQAKKAPGNRQQYLAFLARRDKIVLDSVDDLTRALTSQEFQRLKQRVYSEYPPK